MADSKVRFADCTLRDGEQAPGVFFTLQEKLTIAGLLDAAGVDILDAGMPSVSNEERETLAALVAQRYRATVAATVRALRTDIDLAIECGISEVFLFMPVSPQHLKHKFSIDLRQAQRRIEEAVDYAVGHGLRVNFVAEDSVRAEPRQLAPVLDRVSELGAATAVICDTVGVMTPRGIAEYIHTLRAAMKRSLDFGIHCHNDYGLGTANTLAAVDAGCTLVTSTVCGLGERAGNAVFEEVVCALADLYRADLRIDKAVLQELADTVARASGIFIVPTKPVVGFNVFRHESGVHVDGMLKDLSTYESIDPEPLGRTHELLLGKHSGGGLVEARLAAKGIGSTPELTRRIVERIKVVKVATNKGPMRAMAERLTEMWSRYLAFPEEDFWTIVYDEMARPVRPRAKPAALAVAVADAPLAAAKPAPSADIARAAKQADGSVRARPLTEALAAATPQPKPELAQGTRRMPRITRSRNRATL